MTSLQCTNVPFAHAPENAIREVNELFYAGIRNGVRKTLRNSWYKNNSGSHRNQVLIINYRMEGSDTTA
eukprot:SAG11_NODE_2242_length_3643_cov_7.584368_4_plen_69_part_00